jgi:hypothetical protein
MAEDKIVNLGGTIEGFPKTPIVGGDPVLPTTGGERKSFQDLFAQSVESVRSSQGTSPLPSVPIESIYIGDRYKSSRPFEDSEEMYAQSQSSLNKWGNGLTKMVGTAASAFTAGTAGLLYGIGSAIKDQKFSSLYNNDLNKSFDNANKQLEDAMPNYYKHAEMDAEWWQPANILTANFFSDKLVKNFGYSLGAMAGGFAWTKVLSGIGAINGLVKVGKGLEAVEAVEQSMAQVPRLQKFAAFDNALGSLSQKYLKTPLAAVLTDADRITTSFMGTMGEASMESLQNSNQFRTQAIQDYKDKYGVDPTGAALDEINNYADKVGNFSWGMNVGLLTGTNYIQLPKIIGSSRRVDKALINDIEQEGLGGPWSNYKPSMAGRVLSRARGLGTLLFSPSEAFEEGAQYAIQEGTNDYFNRAYKNHKGTGEFFSNLDASLGNVMGYGFERALSTKEGIENILIGGLSGGLQQSGAIGTYQNAEGKTRIGFGKSGEIAEQGIFGNGGERKANTDLAIDALNKVRLVDKLKDQAKFIGIALGSQKGRQNAIAANDKLVEKDFEHDFALSYIMPRAKYGKQESIQQELTYYQNQAMDAQGYQQLITAGVANANESKEKFMERLEKLKTLSKSVNDIYDHINDKYSDLVDKNGKKVYNDQVIDKMVYATAKIGNYDERIPLVNSTLSNAGINTLDVLQTMDVLQNIVGIDHPNVIATKNALEQINNLKTAEGLDVSKETKDELKGNLIDLMELAARRSLFIDDYNSIKKDPELYGPLPVGEYNEEDETVDVNQQEVPEGKKKAVIVKKELEIGKEYPLAETLRREDNSLQLSPKITVTSKTLGGELEVKLPNGEIAYLTPDQFREFNISDEENDAPDLSEILNKAIDKVLNKKKYADIEKPEDNKLDFINSLNNKELIDDIEKEFKALSKPYLDKIEEENKILKNEKFVKTLVDTLDNTGVFTASNKAGSETDNKKSNTNVINGSIASQKIPGYQRSVLFGNKFQNFPNKDNIYSVYITKENQDRLIKGLVEHLAQGNAKVKTDTTIAIVMVEKQSDGSLKLVGADGKVLPAGANELENAVYQVMPLESLRWSEEFNNESMFIEETAETERLTNIYAKRRERILNSKDLITQKFVPSYGKPINVVGADNGTSVVDAGLVTNEDISTNAALLDIPIAETKLEQGSTSYNAAPGMVFMQTPNGYTRLINKLNSDKDAENIYNAILKLSNNIFRDGYMNDESDLIVDWLRSVSHWGNPKEGKTPGKNSIWWGENVTKKGDKLRLYFGGDTVSEFSLRPSELTKNKESILDILKSMYNNINKKKVDSFDTPYNELTFSKDGQIKIKKQWPNYQTYLLSSEGRTSDQIPLRTKLVPLTDSTSINRDGVYFVMEGWNDVDELAEVPGKVKGETRISLQRKTTGITPKTNVPTFNFKVVGTDSQVGMEYTIDPDGKVVLDESPTNRDSISDIAKDDTTIEKFKKKYVDLGLNKDVETLDREELIRDVTQGVIQESVDRKAKAEAEEDEKRELLAGLDDWMSEGRAETSVVKDQPKSTKDSVAALKEIRKKSSKNNGNYNLSVRVANMINKFKGEDWNKIESFIKTNYPTIGANRIKNILQAGGQKAWGAYSKGGIYIYENAELGTMFHEVFHAVWDMFTSPQEKASIINEFKSRKGSYEDVYGNEIKYADATDDQINERLAREWKDYQLEGTIPAKPTEGKPFILKMFSDLLNFIREFFTGVKAQTNTANLFQRMGTNYYAGMTNPYSQALTYADNGIVSLDEAIFSGQVDPSLIGTGLTSDNVNDIMQQMTYVTLANLKNSGKSLFEVENENRKELYSDLKANLDKITYADVEATVQDGIAAGEYTAEEAAPILANAEALRDAIFKNWNMLSKKHEEEYLSSYSIKFDDFDEDYLKDEDNRSKKGDGYNESTQVDSFRKASAAIKLMLATVPMRDANGDIETSSIGGIRLLPMSEVRTTLLNRLSNSKDIDDMMERLRQLALDNQNYGVIFSRLTNNLPNSEKLNPYTNLKSDPEFQLVAAFHKVFNLQNPEVLTMFVLPNGEISIGDTSLASATDQLADEFEDSVLNTIKNNNKYFKFNGKSFVKIPAQINNIQVGSVDKGIKFLKELGIEFTKEQLDRIPFSKRKFIEATIGLKMSFSKTASIKELTAKNLDIVGRLKDLGEIKAKIENPDFQTTYFNMNGDKVQSYIGQNTMSNFYNFINSVSKKSDLEGTPYSYLLHDKNSQGSVIMDKIFDPETGLKRDSITKYMQVGYTGGLVNEVNRKSKASNSMTSSERIAEELNLNLKGYQLNLVPGDASLGWLLAMGNHVKYNDILLKSDTIKDTFAKYFLSEVELSRDNREIPEIKGRKNTDLRFFKGILGPELHSKVVNLAQNTEMSAQEIYDSFTNEAKDSNKIDDAVNQWIKDDVTDRIKDYTAQGLIKEKKGLYSVKNIEIANKKSLTEEQLRNHLTVLSANYMINNIELHKLVYSDPYQYKEELKRTKNFNSPRQYLTSSKQFNAAYNTIINLDYEPGDIGYTNINRDSLNTITLEDVTAIQDAKMYDPYKETDGGGVITLQGYRLMRKLSGNWNPFEETQYRYDIAYEKVVKNLELTPREQANYDLGNPGINSAYTPIKPSVSGRKGNDKNYNDIVLDKFALYPLSFRVLHEMNPESNALKLYKKMQDGKIDYAVYESGRKVGAEAKVPLYNADGKFNDTAITDNDIIKVPFAITAIQSEVPSKDDNEVRRGSQITKLVTLDFLDCGIPLDFKTGEDFQKRLSAWEALDDAQKMENSDIYKEIDMNTKFLREGTNAAYEMLLDSIGYNKETNELDLNRLSDFLHDQVVKGNTNENILRSIESLKWGNKDIEATTAYNQVRNTLYSIANNSFVSPKISGAQKVQISSTLLESARAEKTTINGKDAYASDLLKFYIDEDGKRVCEIMIQKWFESDTSDEELIKELNESGILNGIGFRIPTQKQNSIDVFKIAKFLPQGFGDAVVVPSALVAKVGSDFDIDKLSVYFKNVYTDREGNIKLIPFLGFGQEGKAELKKLNIKEDINLTYKKSLENGYIQSMENLVSNPLNFNNLVKANSAKILSDIAKDIVIKRDGSRFDYTSVPNMLKQTYMSSLRYAFVSGGYAIGIAAQAQTNHTLNQRALVTIDPNHFVIPSDKFWIKDGIVRFKNYNKINVNGETRATLSRIMDALNENSISDINSMFIDGYVDVTKDGPWIIEMGATPATAGTWLFLNKIGVPIKDIAYFMNQPIIVDYLKELQSKGSTFLFSKPSYKTLIENKKYALANNADRIRGGVLPATEALYRNIGKDQFDAKGRAQQQFILGEFLKYAKMAEHLFRVTQATNFDTTNINDPVIIGRMTEQVINNSPDIYGSNVIGSATTNILANSFIGDIYGKLLSIRNVYSDVLPSEKLSNRTAYQDDIFSRYLGLRKDKFVKIARQIINNSFDFAVQLEGYNQSILPSLVGTEGSAHKLKQFFDSIKEGNPLYGNIIVKSFQYKPAALEGGADTVKLKGKDNKSYDQNQIIYAFQELKNYLISEGKGELYDGLLNIAVVQSGLNSSPLSFTQFLPYEDFEKIYSDTIRNMSSTTINKFARVNAFERNNYNNPDVAAYKKARAIKDADGNPQYNPRKTNLTIANKEAQAAVERGELPTLMNVRTQSSEGKKDFIVFSWEEGTPQERADMKKAGDFSYEKKGLFQKVYDEDNKPFTYKTGNGRAFIYKQINAWGDGIRANEFYDHARKSDLNNGFEPVENEVSDDSIYVHFQDENTEDDLIKGVVISESTDEAIEQANFLNNMSDQPEGTTFETDQEEVEEEEEIAPVEEKLVPLTPGNLETPSGKLELNDGKEYLIKDINAKLLENLGYSAKDAGKILKAFC